MSELFKLSYSLFSFILSLTDLLSFAVHSQSSRNNFLTLFLLFHDSSLLIMSLIYYFGHSHFPLIYSSIRSHSLITHSPFHSFIIALSDLLSFCQNSTLTHSLHSLCDLSLSILLLYHSHTLIIRIFTLSSRTLILSICFYFYSSIPLSLALSLSKTLTIYNE